MQAQVAELEAALAEQRNDKARFTAVQVNLLLSEQESSARAKSLQAELAQLRDALTAAQTREQAMRELQHRAEQENATLREQLRLAGDRTQAKQRPETERAAQRQQKLDHSKLIEQLRAEVTQGRDALKQAQAKQAQVQEDLSAAQVMLAQSQEGLAQALDEVEQLRQQLTAHAQRARATHAVEQAAKRQERQAESAKLQRLRSDLKVSKQELRVAQASLKAALVREGAALQSEATDSRYAQRRQAEEATAQTKRAAQAAEREQKEAKAREKAVAKAERAAESRRLKDATARARRETKAAEKQQRFENSEKLKSLRADKRQLNEDNKHQREHIAGLEAQLAQRQISESQLRAELADQRRHIEELEAARSTAPTTLQPPTSSKPVTLTKPTTSAPATSSKPVTRIAPANPTPAKPGTPNRTAIADSALASALRQRQTQDRQRLSKQHALVEDAKRRGYSPFHDLLLRSTQRQVQLEDALAKQQAQRGLDITSPGLASGEDWGVRAMAAALEARAAYYLRCERSQTGPIAVWVSEPYLLDRDSEVRLQCEVYAAIAKLEARVKCAP